ncbi:plasmalemma vesicle-associated protein-like [Brienomyrus brachyistius]|uniref:plasmalemma vesicle-associated protein-like n=1 Tax=Brienomyrus brachyistius TaxID=42636 RepID=UPI0020B32C61|nr:plasmalemma vesicle-associated protein-like [Brienomyrus brachyistius]
MYRSYTQAKLPMDTKRLRKSKERSCGYYLKIVLFFSSLIQSLIIISLVLFLVYGQSGNSGEEKRVQELEKSCTKLMEEKRSLQQHNLMLYKKLNETNITIANKDKQLIHLRVMANFSYYHIQGFQKRLNSCEEEMQAQKKRQIPGPVPDGCQRELTKVTLQVQQLLREKFNVTQTSQELNTAQEAAKKKIIVLEQSNADLLRQKASMEKSHAMFSQECKQDYMNALKGISTVTNAFLRKIENFFPSATTFFITCEKRSTYLEQIHTNCTGLSREMESKFQSYLNHVGHTMSNIRKNNTDLIAQNEDLTKDLQECRQSSLARVEEGIHRLHTEQERHGREKEQMLKDKKKLESDKELLEQQVRLKSLEVAHINTEKLRLNASLLSCMRMTGVGSSLVPRGQSEFGDTISHLKELQKYTVGS